MPRTGSFPPIALLLRAAVLLGPTCALAQEEEIIQAQQASCPGCDILPGRGGELGTAVHSNGFARVFSAPAAQRVYLSFPGEQLIELRAGSIVGGLGPQSTGKEVAISPDGETIAAAVVAVTSTFQTYDCVVFFFRPVAGWAPTTSGNVAACTRAQTTPPAGYLRVQDPGVEFRGLGAALAFADSLTLFAGAPDATRDGVQTGAVVRFRRVNSSIGVEGFLYPPTGSTTAKGSIPGNKFGAAIDVSSRSIVIGSPSDAPTGQGQVVRIRLLGGAPDPDLPVEFLVSGEVGDKFGTSVGVAANESGNETIVVGAPLMESAPGTRSGGAVVFESFDEVQPVRVGRLSPPPELGAAAEAGIALDFDGGQVALGSPGADANAGALLLYRLAFRIDTPLAKGSSNALPDRVAQRSAGLAGDRFGAAVSISPGRVLGGAPMDDSGAFQSSGAVASFALDELFRSGFEG